MIIPGSRESTLAASGFQLAVATLLPFTLIISSNVIIIVTVREASKKRADLARRTVSTETANLSRMTVAVSAAFLVTSAPYRLFTMSLQIPEVLAVFENFEKTCSFMLYSVFTCSLYTLYLMNFCLNFFMYYLGGGRKYRNDLKELFAGVCKQWIRSK